MNKKDFINWIEEIKEKTPIFLKKMEGSEKKGFFRYSYSGDYFGEKIKWGLGNSVFALKIYYTLGIKPDNLKDIEKFILLFWENDSFFDPVVKKTSFPYKFFNFLKTGKIKFLSNKETIRAETRQTISALNLFGLDKNLKNYSKFPQNKEEIKNYLKKLDWELPWGSGSHFSHLLFFLSFSKLKNKLELIDFAVNWVNDLQKEDGSWHKGEKTSLQQKINGAMKIITGLKVASEIGGWNKGKVYFLKSKNLIDLCLSVKGGEHACDNFNIVYVLKYCNQIEGSEYRYREIEKFMSDRLDLYKNFYHKNFGAFSFYKNKTNRFYYGALISKGKNEPDIHGTVLFLWGIAVIASFWELDKKLKIKEFLT